MSMMFVQAGIASKLDPPSFLLGTAAVEIGADQRGAPERGENAALCGWFAGDAGGAPARGLGAIFGQAASQWPDQVAIGWSAEHLEARKSTLASSRSMVFGRHVAASCA
jgi:hypothetical protein